MIEKALRFIKDEVNQYLILRTASAPGEERVVLSNIVDGNGDDDGGLPDNKIILSLVFIEEERIHKSQDHYIRSASGSISTANPALRLNLYVMFAAHFSNKNYMEALKQLSYTISYFQSRNVFDSDTYPLLDPGVKRLVVELFTLPMDQQSQLWQSFGGKFLPSVMYKIRMITINEKDALFNSPVIESMENS